MEDRSNWHKVIETRARKGKLVVDEIRKWRIRQGWFVDNRDVRANGVDLVAWIGRNPSKPDNDRVYEVYEITNWNKRGFCLQERLDGMIANLNSEEKEIKTKHPDSTIVKIIIFSYRENLRKLGYEHAHDLTRKNHICLVFGYEMELTENGELIKGWSDAQELPP
jgi:hypothetical protein